jgi:hypothetical protein
MDQITKDLDAEKAEYLERRCKMRGVRKFDLVDLTIV